MFNFKLAILILLASGSACAQQRIVQTDSIGNKQYHLQQYVRLANKICPVDSIGNIEYHKGCTNVDPKLLEAEAKALVAALEKAKKEKK
jgi:hypothetical protein